MPVSQHPRVEPQQIASQRTPAPGALELVQRFVNTRDIEPEFEELNDPADLETWLRRRGLIGRGDRVTRRAFARGLALREALRALMRVNNGLALPPAAARVLNDEVERARLRVAFDATGIATVEPRATGVDAAFGRLLAIVFAAMADGSWIRLKACREDGCQWVFWDTSKNRSGVWCSMRVCGNRQKSRAYRARQAPGRRS